MNPAQPFYIIFEQKPAGLCWLCTDHFSCHSLNSSSESQKKSQKKAVTLKTPSYFLGFLFFCFVLSLFFSFFQINNVSFLSTSCVLKLRKRSVKKCPHIASASKNKTTPAVYILFTSVFITEICLFLAAVRAIKLPYDTQHTVEKKAIFGFRQ